MAAFEKHLRKKKGINDGEPSPKPVRQKISRTEACLRMVGRSHNNLFDEDKIWSDIIQSINAKGQSPGKLTAHFAFSDALFTGYSTYAQAN